jgi:hypothetical protein
MKGLALNAQKKTPDLVRRFPEGRYYLMMEGDVCCMKERVPEF